MSYTDVSKPWSEECEDIRKMGFVLDLKSFGIDKLERDIPT